MREHSEHLDGWMSRAIDGELGDDEERRFRAHLADCDACAAEFAALEGSVAALRGRGSDALEPAAVAAIVEGAMPAAEAPRRGWGRPVLILSHAAALLLGLLLAWQRGAAGPAAPVERVVRVEVPVEVPVETIREVPVEVVVTERVEVPVEVPVERIVRERVVQTVPSPLQPRFDEALALANTLASLASTGAAAARDAFEAGAARAAASDRGGVLAAADPPPLASRAGHGPWAAAASRGLGSADSPAALVVRREGDRVQLSTRGTLDEVVPALIEALDSGEPAVAAAALDRLEALRADLDRVEPGEPRARLTALAGPSPDRIDRAGGLLGLLGASRARRDGASDGPSVADRWRVWWDGRVR